MSVNDGGVIVVVVVVVVVVGSHEVMVCTCGVFKTLRE